MRLLEVPATPTPPSPSSTSLGNFLPPATDASTRFWRIGISKAHFTPLDVHDVDSRGEIRDLDGRPGSVGGGHGQGKEGVMTALESESPVVANPLQGLRRGARIDRVFHQNRSVDLHLLLLALFLLCPNMLFLHPCCPNTTPCRERARLSCKLKGRSLPGSSPRRTATYDSASQGPVPRAQGH